MTMFRAETKLVQGHGVTRARALIGTCAGHRNEARRHGWDLRDVQPVEIVEYDPGLYFDKYGDENIDYYEPEDWAESIETIELEKEEFNHIADLHEMVEDVMADRQVAKMNCESFE